MGEDEGGFCPAPHLSPTCPAPLPGQGGARWASYEDLGQGVGTRAGDKGLAGVAGDSVDGLLVLLAVGRDLLHARLVVQAPQTEGAVVACAGAGAGRAVTGGGSPAPRSDAAPKPSAGLSTGLAVGWGLSPPPARLCPVTSLTSLPVTHPSGHQVFTEHLYCALGHSERSNLPAQGVDVAMWEMQ